MLHFTILEGNRYVFDILHKPWTHERSPIGLSSLDPADMWYAQKSENELNTCIECMHICVCESWVYTLRRFIRILMLSKEHTYRTITVEFERSSNISPNSWTKYKHVLIIFLFFTSFSKISVSNEYITEKLDDINKSQHKNYLYLPW